MTKIKLTAEQKEANRLARRKAKKEANELARIESERNQKEVSSIVITIEWKKSRVWNSNPNCEAEVRFKDGSFERSPVFKCSGCGYDKESTVIADVFNAYLKYKLYRPLSPTDSDGGAPYGITNSSEWKYFGGGIGVSCYYPISEAIGGKFERVSSGKTFDVYKYIDN